jgi:hypothetical protein
MPLFEMNGSKAVSEEPNKKKGPHLPTLFYRPGVKSKIRFPTLFPNGIKA